jgi:phenolic acid decarboxylase
MNEMKKEYCDFIGSKAFEDDNGWSYEVWQAAQQAVFKRIANKFLGYGDIDYTGKEIAKYINYLANQNVQE